MSKASTSWLTDCLPACPVVCLSVCIHKNQLRQSDVSDSQSSKVPLNDIVASAHAPTPLETTSTRTCRVTNKLSTERTKTQTQNQTQLELLTNNWSICQNIFSAWHLMVSLVYLCECVCVCACLSACVLCCVCCVRNEDWQLNVFSLTSNRCSCWLISPWCRNEGHALKWA